jgi:hypothetical protein
VEWQRSSAEVTGAASVRRSRAIAGLAAAVPLLWAPLSLLHPFTFEEMAEDGRTTAWLIVHFGQLPLTALLALVMLQLLAPLAGGAATLARIAIVAWAVFFSAFDSLAGVASGLLVRGGHVDAAFYLFEHRVVGGDLSLIGLIAHPLWGVTALASVLSLRLHGAGRPTQISLLLSLPFAVTHVGPLATLALLSLAFALWTGLTTPLALRRLAAH